MQQIPIEDLHKRINKLNPAIKQLEYYEQVNGIIDAYLVDSYHNKDLQINLTKEQKDLLEETIVFNSVSQKFKFPD
jgi:hypothetical protein